MSETVLLTTLRDYRKRLEEHLTALRDRHERLEHAVPSGALRAACDSRAVW